MKPLDVAVDCAAVARLTRLVTEDVLLDPIRNRILDRWPAETTWVGSHDDPTGGWVQATKIGTLVTCPWCASQWIAFGVVILRWKAPRLWDPIARALAASQIAGMAAEVTS